MLSHRIKNLKPSAPLAISSKAKTMQKLGHDVIDLSVGESDFDTPSYVKEAAVLAIHQGYTKYTAVGGNLELKESVVRKFQNENNIETKIENIIVSNGAKQIIFNALFATLNPMDEVIIPAPYWGSYLDMVQIAEGHPVVVSPITHDGKIDFKITASLLAQHISPKTKWFILNSPGNPSGFLYSEQDLLDLAEVLRKNPHVWVLCDDIYEHIIYEAKAFHTLAGLAPDLKSRILTVNGVSKSYAMTGWRIGFAAGPLELIQAMTDLQSQSTSNPCSVSQQAALSALDGNKAFLKRQKEAFFERRHTLYTNLPPSLVCTRLPQGAFYLYPSCDNLLKKRTPNGQILESDVEVAEYFLQEALVSTVPGQAFGMSPHIRLSYATSKERLEEAGKRLQNAIQKLS